MTISVSKIDDVKVVNKPWGFERWIAHGGQNSHYALKEIFIRAPHRSSLQFHEFKEETNYILSGRGVLYYSDTKIDVEAYKAGNISDDYLSELASKIKRADITSGTVFHVRPGFLHRVEAVEDLLMIEASTLELDDVFRLSDDTGRDHGLVEKEHI